MAEILIIIIVIIRYLAYYLYSETLNKTLTDVNYAALRHGLGLLLAIYYNDSQVFT